MKILEINKFFYIKGGAEKHFFDAAELLKKNGHEVAFFSMRHKNNFPTKWDKYFISTVGFTNEFSWWKKIKGSLRDLYSFEAKRKINELLDEFKPNIVHIHNIYHQLSPMILFEIKKRKIPIVMTVHDYKIVNPNYNLFHNGKFYNRCKNGKYYQCFLDKCFKNSYSQSFLAMLEMYWHKFWGTYRKNIDLYIVPSEFVKNILAENGIAVDKIKVLPHFIVEENLIENRFPNNNSEKFALCLGRISKNKGTDKIIKIFEELKDVKLYLAGKIEDDLKIPESKNIKYLGVLNNDEVKEYIEKSLLVISGSRLPETFGLVALEAISQGKPFLGFKSGAYGEIIENGLNGFLAEDENELKKEIENIFDEKIIFNNEKIKKKALYEYSQKKYLKKIENIFRELIK